MRVKVYKSHMWGAGGVDEYRAEMSRRPLCRDVTMCTSIVVERCRFGQGTGALRVVKEKLRVTEIAIERERGETWQDSAYLIKVII